MKFPKIFGLDCSIKTHHNPPIKTFLGLLVGNWVGVQSAGGERSANFARRTLAEKGGVILQPLRRVACQLAAFSSKFFQTGRSAFLLSRSTRRAELGGRIQCSVKEYS